MARAILSVSRRTDVPAFHAAWFRRRLAEGFCEVLHPYTGRVQRVSLAPEDVAAWVFWTRRPGPLLPEMRALRSGGAAVVAHVTINGYGAPIETHNPPIDAAIRGFERLAGALGPEAAFWRYDPILLSDEVTPSVHLRRFGRLAAALEGMTTRCTFSFVDFYGKTTRNLTRIERARGAAFERPDDARRAALARELAAIAAARGMELLSCCDDALVGEGVGKSRCIDPGAIERAARRAGGAPLGTFPAAPTRRDCGCVRAIDIGAYDTCAFGCAYCYAVRGRDAAIDRLRGRRAGDPLMFRPARLAGGISGGAGAGVAGSGRARTGPAATGPAGAGSACTRPSSEPALDSSIGPT